MPDSELEIIWGIVEKLNPSEREWFDHLLMDITCMTAFVAITPKGAKAKYTAIREYGKEVAKEGEVGRFR